MEEEDIWEWYKPHEVTRWEDVMLANRFCAEQLAEEGADRLPASQNQALVLRVEHQLTVVEMPG